MASAEAKVEDDESVDMDDPDERRRYYAEAAARREVPEPPRGRVVQILYVEGTPIGTGVAGATIGSCPRCEVRGAVGNYCWPCCLDQGCEEGCCPVSGALGPVGHPCLIHPTRVHGYSGPEVMGNCPLCDKEGLRGTLCTACKDQCLVCE